jgi:hypothetical protein
MRISKYAAAIAGLALAATLGLGAVPASASSVPLPKIQTDYTGWYHGWRVRPGSIYFGMGAGGAAPRLAALHWTSYGQSGAWANGKWWIDDCKPNCAQAGYFVPARVHAYDVFNHRGPGRNFGEIRVTWRNGRWFNYINSKGDWAYDYIG